eukprot:TRINITY_DN2028_c0_g1_i8.p1 TRINITY_DN2028_c0_g1~~TRINITY_DN2028_c0_g1_i8.p1  ORF type:complete len:331 (-),score=13.68 TRINITY_DN2028_c0_g1_i8:592-1584(-)
MRLEVQPEIRHANHFYSIYGIPGNLMSVGDVRSMIAAQDAEEESIAPKPIQKNNKSPIIRRLTSEVSSTVSKSMESVRVDRAEDKDKGEDAHIKPLATPKATFKTLTTGSPHVDMRGRGAVASQSHKRNSPSPTSVQAFRPSIVSKPPTQTHSPQRRKSNDQSKSPQDPNFKPTHTLNVYPFPIPNASPPTQVASHLNGRYSPAFTTKATVPLENEHLRTFTPANTIKTANASSVSNEQNTYRRKQTVIDARRQIGFAQHLGTSKSVTQHPSIRLDPSQRLTQPFAIILCCREGKMPCKLKSHVHLLEKHLLCASRHLTLCINHRNLQII